MIANGIVYTLAGGVNGGYADGEAAAARFSGPRALVIDAQNNIYVADTGNNVIRKISGGKVTTFAGNGKAGYKDGASKDAQFNTPSGLVMDKSGFLYVADTQNHVIRKISPAGNVSTVAGKTEGIAGFRNGLAEEALFNEPAALVLDSQDNLYIADAGNQLIRKLSAGNVVTLAGSIGTIIPGTTYYKGELNFPKGLTILENGILIVADTWNSRLRAVLPTGQIVTLAGTGVFGKVTGAIDEAVLGRPTGTTYFNHKLYISDADNHLIWELDINPDNLQVRSDFAEPSEQIQIWVNGERLVTTTDSQPYLWQERTMLPLRLLCEKLGWTVNWTKEGTITITKGSQEKILTTTNPNLQLKNSRTMAGVRYFAEMFGGTVDWVSSFRAVDIWIK